MNQRDFIDRVNSRLKAMKITEPCFLCGAPSQVTITADGQAVRACVNCAIMSAESRYSQGQNIGVKLGDKVILYVHPEK